MQTHLNLLSLFFPLQGIAGGRRHQRMTALSPQSSLFFCFFEHQSIFFFFFSQMRLRSCLLCPLTVVGFCCMVLCSFSNFPPQDSSMPHYQVKSGGAAKIHKEPGLQAHTYTHTRGFQGPWEVFHQQLHRITNRVKRWTGGEIAAGHMYVNALQLKGAEREAIW